MKNSLFSCRAILLALCLLLTLPVAATEAAAKKTKHVNQESHEALVRRLVEFGKHIADDYNACVQGNKKNKLVKQNSDGSFTATYHEIDKNSIEGTYNKTGKKGVKYIGTLHYNEVTYTCRAATRAEALKGPFRTSGTTSTTELIKYVNGKWRY